MSLANPDTPCFWEAWQSKAKVSLHPCTLNSCCHVCAHRITPWVYGSNTMGREGMSV